ncbi:MAG: LPXTG cell wall anchor domain-containing protein, partial [Firmicutes bacterium]|nr:LPXTG cell wall anchor domain-containing protein [Bacillota bacterium]
NNSTRPGNLPADFDLTADISHSSFRIEAENERSNDFALPETGGLGTDPYTLTGILLMGTALTVGYRKRRRKERGKGS